MPRSNDTILTQVSGTQHGQRRLNGIQTPGRPLRNLSEPAYDTLRTRDVVIEVRDRTLLFADTYCPHADGRFPALVSFSCYPRQIQDVGAPLGFIEAGAVDFFAPRGYAHIVVNARGTGGSDGVWTMLDETERNDLYDVIEWAAAQPWCDGNVGMLGISYFAMAQIAAAAVHPPHLKAIFPIATTVDFYEAAWHHGLANAGFVSAWIPAVGVMSQKPDAFWEGHRLDAARKILAVPAIHERMQHLNGEAIVNVLKDVIHSHYPEVPFGQLWQETMVEHPAREAFWDARDNRPALAGIEIPVYLGCDWDNAPLHLPSTFVAWEGLRSNPNVRMAMLPPGGLAWPWECLHEEALGWYDHWLKGLDTGIMDGPAVRYVVPGLRADGRDGADDWRESASWPPASEPLGFYLRGDGTLGEQDDATDRQYLSITPEIGRPKNANPPTLPDRLEWVTAPFAAPAEFAGEIALTLDATASAHDTAWIAVLYDVSPDGTREAITAGWLRASHAHSDREPQSVVPGTRETYAIPVIQNARHLDTGHALALVLTSSDAVKDAPTILGFRHAPIGESSLNTVHSSSRLTLPMLPAR
ncbi:MAG: CocE/NonD family hydrolase [Thermomicrobiales bacterium]